MADVSKVKLNGTAYNIKDASVPSWAKQSSKPSYTQDEVGDGSTYKRVTSTEKSTWNSKGTYSKPSGGIPKSDLASAVQTSLEKADTALQSFTESDPTVPSWAKQSSKPSYTASEVGAIATSAKGAANGVASLDSAGKVPSSQLPSYVDDVLEYSAKSSFPSTGETGKIYVDTSTNKTYRWSGSAYVEISASLALGETSSTAYYGDKGKTAYNHSQVTSGNPHNVTKSDVGLGNVGNFKAVSTVASQGLSDTEKSNARANIGAGTGNGTYSKPSGGIPKSDLASAVQTSLGKADTALQSFTESDPTVPSWAKQSSKPTYTYSEVGAAPSQHTHSSIESKGDYKFDASTKPNSLEYGVSTGFVNRDSGYGSFGGVLNVRAYTGGGGTLQLYSPYSPTYGGTHLKARFGNYDVDQGNSWTDLKDIAWVSDIPSSLPASDVYSWAKQSSKPSYTQDEVGDGSTYKRVTSSEKSYLAQLVDNSFKNFLRYTFEGSTSANGITVTRNADYTITANGTAGSGNSYIILSQNLILPAGTYAISAVNAYTSNCYIYDNGSWESVYGRQERTFDGSTPVTILLRVAAGTTLSNVVIKPMICRIEAWRVSTAFAPYRSDYNSIGKFIDGVDIGGTDAVYSADLNSIDRTITRIYYNPSNAPYGLYGFMLVKTLYTDTNTVFQEVTAVNNQTGTMFDSVRPKFIRTKTGGSWDHWIEMSENNRFLIDDGSYEASSKTFNTTYLKYHRMYLVSISRYYSSTSGSGVAMYAFNNQPDIPLVTTITEKSDCKASISVSNGVLTINYSASGYYVTSISLL